MIWLSFPWAEDQVPW